MFETLRSIVVGARTGDVYRECRDCGTVVGSRETCPSCDSEDVACFEVD